jgi:hypothetical protein
MDISNIPIRIQCPNCSFEVEVLLKQVIAEEIILCPGCTKEIKLVDKDGSASRAQGEINEALEDFGRKLK